MNAEYISLPEAAAMLPSKPHPLTLRRWCRTGIRGVRLRYMKAGRAVLTRQEWLDAFLAESTPPHTVTTSDPPQRIEGHPTRPTGRRAKDIAAAEATCARFGL